jgi:hypothetical protein
MEDEARFMLSSAAAGDIDTVVWRIEQGVHVDHIDLGQWSVARIAAAKGNLEMLRVVVEDHDADLGVVGEYGKFCGSLLHVAVVGGSVDMCEWLVKRGLDPNGKDRLGRTPFMIAVWASQLKVAKFFLDEHGANADVVDKRGMNAFALAAQTLELARAIHVRLYEEAACKVLYKELVQRNRAVLEWLLERGGVNMERKDWRGRSILMLAVKRGCAESVSWLVRSLKFDVTEKCEDGWRVWDHVASRMADSTEDSHTGVETSAEVEMLQAICLLLPVTISRHIAFECRQPFQSGPYTGVDVRGLFRKGSALGKQLPRFLKYQANVLVEHLSLPAPLLEIVKRYAEPTVEDAWSVGLAVLVRKRESKKKRARTDSVHTEGDGPVRRSTRLGGRSWATAVVID